MYFIKKKRKNRVKLNLRKMKDQIISGFHFLRGKIKRRSVIIRLNKADIILARPGLFSLSFISLLYRIFLRSKYVHSMLYIGNGKIIHTTTKEGVTLHKVPQKIYKRSRYTIFRVKELNSEQRDQIVDAALGLQNMKIDFLGLIGNIPKNIFKLKKTFLKMEKNRIWCSKMIYASFLAVGIELVPEDERGIITSDSLSRSEILEVVK